MAAPRVLVTVGTDHHPFDRLVAWVDEWHAGLGADAPETLVQHGTAAPPRSAHGAPLLTLEELDRALDEVDAVVCHGGPATIMECLDRGLRPIVVPRQRALGEHVDDHQVTFARRLAAEGTVVLADGPDALGAAIGEALATGRAPGPLTSGEGEDAVARFAALAEELVGGRRPRAEGEILFIGGLGRSGSTLLERLLDQVPGVGALGEVVHLWERGVGDDDLCGCGDAFSVCPFWSEVGEKAFAGWASPEVAEATDLRFRVDRNRFVPLMVVPLWPRLRRQLRTYAGHLDRLYDAAFAVSGEAVLVDSSKHASTAFLLRAIRHRRVRVVHLVRDPRGVAHSWTKEVVRPEDREGRSTMATIPPWRAAVRYVAYNALFHALRLTGTPVLSVRYEDLVRDPEPVLRRVLEHAGLPPGVPLPVSGRTARLGRGHSVAGNPMRFRDGELELRADEEWRQRMPRRSAAVVGAVTAPLRLRYGYR